MKVIKYPFHDNEKGTEIDVSIQSGVSQTAPLHTHEYFEFFLVLDGKALHLANDTVQNLEGGSLVFIRPEDAHCYDFYKSFDFIFVNFAFSLHMMKKITDLFLPDKPFLPLLNTTLPPSVLLSPEETQKLYDEIQALTKMNKEEDPEFTRCHIKSFLSSLFCRYFFYSHREEIAAPPWLSSVVLKMQKIENARLGFQRMLSLSHCSPEHLCREFKKYYHSTPNQFINKQRLGYSLYLLSYTHMEIIDIAEHCGFNNLSHFYHLFKQNFSVSPKKFRTQSSAVTE
ncbi:helix-turn-helix transcriptional regulator [Scatolibacter rhodanostii]|uniref:helix-turn-helix transcriptional regulator n=1 Tax=Scatolibacter rhodanostii TaxID=2014781 RepID=UPI000C087660|nr:AraC family transcriptional regulator [Scatolibacter rhodanostii]